MISHQISQLIVIIYHYIIYYFVKPHKTPRMDVRHMPMYTYRDMIYLLRL